MRYLVGAHKAGVLRGMGVHDDVTMALRDMSLIIEGDWDERYQEIGGIADDEYASLHASLNYSPLPLISKVNDITYWIVPIDG